MNYHDLVYNHDGCYERFTEVELARVVKKILI